MYCMQCGKETENNSICSHCGAVHNKTDPFCMLGDLESVAADRGLTDSVCKSNVAITPKDCFSTLGDISSGNDERDLKTTDKKPSMDPFHEMGNIDGSPIAVRGGVTDTPVAGGFKSLGDLTAEDDDSDNHQIVDFAWKRWMSVAVCCTVLIVVLVVLLTNITSRESNGYETAIEEKINGAIIQGMDLPLSYQFNNAVLMAIEFELLEYNQNLNAATVNFSYVNVLALADTYSESLNDADAFYEYCVDKITNGTAPMLNKTIPVTYTETKDEGITHYIVIDSLELADVMTGGVASEYIKLTGVDEE